MIPLGILAAASKSGAVDPTSNVVSLLHFNGAEGSAAFADETTARWTAFGGPFISTAVSVFGGASGRFPGSGFIDGANSEKFALGTGDFTLEMWVRPDAMSGIGAVLFDDRFGAYGPGMVLYRPNSMTDFRFFTNGAERIIGITPAVGVFSHLAIVRHSGTTRAYVNGLQAGGDYADTGNYSATQYRLGAALDSGSSFKGYIDEFRVMRGVAVYTGPFTPPGNPFSPP